jgi:2-polyprenyl-6-methoxyphenol hydroxylase-like FAD-dependent oxidoreductase
LKQAFAVICGAGVAGLAAAWWLRRAGWRVLVVEQAQDLRDGGHMMGLSGPGLATVRRMGLVPQLREVAYADMGQHVYRDRRGREILRIDYHEVLTGIEWITLRRTALVQVLRQALLAQSDDLEVRFGVTVTALEQDAAGIDIQLSDGSRHAADLLIAADGVHSTLRRDYFSSDANCLKSLGYRYASYDVADKQQLGEDFLSYTEPGLQSEYYGLGGGRLAALHVWRSHASGLVAPDQRPALLRQQTARSHEFVRGTLAAVGVQDPIVVDDLALVELPSWRQQRIVLLGDAAHSLSLISGQGAGVALASASILAEELERAAGGNGRAPDPAQLDAALAQHDRRLRPTILRLQQRSRKLAPVFVPASAAGFALRNFTLRVMPGFLLRRYFVSGLKSEAEALAALA